MVWKKLTSKTATGTTDALTTDTFTAKKFLNVITNEFKSSTTGHHFRFNADTGSNYTRRQSINGGADGTSVSQSTLDFGVSNDDVDFSVSYMINIPSKEKLIINFIVNTNTTGAGNAPHRGEFIGKWVNTVDPVTSLTLYNPSAGDIDTNSNIIVIGTD